MLDGTEFSSKLEMVVVDGECTFGFLKMALRLQISSFHQFHPEYLQTTKLTVMEMVSEINAIFQISLPIFAATEPIIHVLPPTQSVSMATGTILTVKSVTPHRSTTQRSPVIW